MSYLACSKSGALQTRLPTRGSRPIFHTIYNLTNSPSRGIPLSSTWRRAGQLCLFEPWEPSQVPSPHFDKNILVLNYVLFYTGIALEVKLLSLFSSRKKNFLISPSDCLNFIFHFDNSCVHLISPNTWVGSIVKTRFDLFVVVI